MQDQIEKDAQQMKEKLNEIEGLVKKYLQHEEMVEICEAIPNMMGGIQHLRSDIQDFEAAAEDLAAV